MLSTGDAVSGYPPSDLSRDLDFRTRFVREANVASKLDHPNIVSVYNRGETEEGQLWIAMQFVEGTDADAARRQTLGTVKRPWSGKPWPGPPTRRRLRRR